MSTVYEPYLHQAFTQHFPAGIDDLHEFDLIKFLSLVEKPKLHLILGKLKDMVFDATMAMKYSDERIASAFIEECFPSIGLEFGWILCEIHGVEVDLTRLVVGLDSLNERMRKNCKKNLVLPNSIFMSSIYDGKEYAGVIVPDLNPLLIGILCSKKDQSGHDATDRFLTAHPLSVESRFVLKMMLADLSRLDQHLGTEASQPNHETVLKDLAEAESKGLIDPYRVGIHLDSLGGAVGDIRPLLRAFYTSMDPEWALQEILYSRGAHDVPMAGSKVEEFVVKAIHKILSAAENKTESACTLVKEYLLLNGALYPTSFWIYAYVLRAYLEYFSAEESAILEFTKSLLAVLDQKPDSKLFVGTIACTLYGETGIPNQGKNESIFLAQSIAGKSTRLAEIMGDLAVKLYRTDKAYEFDPVQIRKMAVSGMLSMSHLKSLVKSQRGRALCISANLPKEILQGLPTRVWDDQLMSDIGL